MEAILRSTGEVVYIIPWIAQMPRPWGDKHERIMRVLEPATRATPAKIYEQVVRLGKLKLENARDRHRHHQRVHSKAVVAK